MHFFVQSVPSHSLSEIVRIVKSITAKKLYQEHPEIEAQLWGGNFWTIGYYTNTVWQYSNEEVIRKYVENQGKETEYKKYILNSFPLTSDTSGLCLEVVHYLYYMVEYRKMSHSVSSLSVHLVWVARYLYPVLTRDLQMRTRDLIVQICNSENVKILTSVVSKDHVHIHVEYRTSLSISVFVKRTSRIHQQEFPHLHKQYWGRHFWAVGY